LIERVGPAPKSGLYVIVPRGQAAVEHRDQYGEPNVDFAALVDKQTKKDS